MFGKTTIGLISTSKKLHVGSGMIFCQFQGSCQFPSGMESKYIEKIAKNGCKTWDPLVLTVLFAVTTFYLHWRHSPWNIVGGCSMGAENTQ